MEGGRKQRIESILREAMQSGRSQLLESEVYQILREIEIPPPRFAVLPIDAPEGDRLRAAEGLLGPPKPGGIVVKIQSAEILHKTEAGGIAFAAAEPAAVARAIGEVVGRVRKSMPGATLSSVLLCERIPYQAHIPGNELLLSLRQDPALGPIVVVGIGGILTEWYGKLAPNRTTWVLSAHDPILARETPPDLAGIGPAFSLLFEPSRLHREAPANPGLFWSALRRWADLARSFGIDSTESSFVLEEVEINPLIAVPGIAPIALDGIGRVGTARPRVRRRRIEKIANLMKPRSVAVVGASAKGMNPGRVILGNLLSGQGDYRGHVYAVHPKEREIDTIPCVPTIGELPERVDLAVISVPAEGARDAIREFVEKAKAHSIILIPGGFAETGDRALADSIIEALEAGRSQADGGPVLCGGNCLGIVSKEQYNTFFLPLYKLPFSPAPGDNLAMVSQSGAYLVTFASNLDGILFPKASISYGNQMDLTVSDFVEHYLDDSGLGVIGCYIEGFEPLDGLRFVNLIREHRRRGRAVIVFKAGKTALGAQAAASHTASLAGDYAAARALFTGAGAVVAETLNEFEDFTKLFSMLYDRVPGGCRTALISNAGFECSVSMDALYDLTLGRLADSTREALKACLPSIAHADNPIDATPMATTMQFVAAVEALVADPGIDAIVISPVPPTPALDTLAPDPSGAHRENCRLPGSLAQELVRVFKHSGKPIVANVDSGRIYDESVEILERGGIPTFRKIDRATRALSEYCRVRRGSGREA
jgi:acyl-CoA synthetase (NDP forming)